MKKTMVALVALVLLVLPLLGMAAEMQQLVEPRDTDAYVDGIDATLTFSGSIAICSGYVDPAGSYSAQVTVTLYKLVDGSWTRVTGWSGSSTGGNKASAGGTVSVGSGSYRLVTSGNVNSGSAYPSTSVTKTK